MTHNPTSPPKPIGTRYVVKGPIPTLYVYETDFIGAVYTSDVKEAFVFESLKVASQVSDAIGGEVVDA